MEFSELVKMAKLHGESTKPEKWRQFLESAFSELVVYDGNVAEIKAKEGFGAILNRHGVRFGAGY